MITHFKGMNGLSPIPKRQPNGRKRRDKSQIDHAEGALRARCIRLGFEPTRANLREVRAPWWGCNAGIAMARAVDTSERADLFDAIQHIRRTYAAYGASIGAPSRYAKCLALLLPVDEMTADASSPAPDMRSDEEKARAAQRAWMELQGWLGHADAAARSAVIVCAVNDEECPDRLGMVMALRCVLEGMRGQAIMCRDRNR